MGRQCEVSGKKTSFGNTRSHSLRHTRRTFKPNIQKKRVFDPRTGAYKTMRVSIMIDGFTDEDDRANIKMEVTGFILR